MTASALDAAHGGESQIITKIEINNVPVAVPGEYPREDGFAIVGEGYTVRIMWYERYYNETGDGMYGTRYEGIFQRGCQYFLDFYCYADAGYVFSKNCSIIINGKKNTTSILNFSDDYTYGSFSIDHDLRYILNHIALEGIPEAVVGRQAATDSIRLLNDPPCTLSASWYLVGFDDITVFNGIFEEGNLYELLITLHVDERYRLKITDGYYTVVADGTDLNASSLYMDYTVYFRYDLTTYYYDGSEITGVKEFAPGDKATTDGIETPGLWCALSAQWYECDEYGAIQQPFEGTFEKKPYCLVITLIPEDHAVFSMSYAMINGKETPCESNTDGVKIYHFVDFRNQITQVDLSHSCELRAGAEICKNCITVPATAAYTVESTWVTAPSSEQPAQIVTGEFQANTGYVQRILVKATDGTFPKDVVVTFNGKVIPNSQITNYGNGVLEFTTEVSVFPADFNWLLLLFPAAGIAVGIICILIAKNRRKKS